MAVAVPTLVPDRPVGHVSERRPHRRLSDAGRDAAAHAGAVHSRVARTAPMDSNPPADLAARSDGISVGLTSVRALLDGCRSCRLIVPVGSADFITETRQGVGVDRALSVGGERLVALL